MNNKPDLTAAQEFVWRAARLLDRHRFAFHFGGGDAEAVLAALRPYQNVDGGFGNALEPDFRGPVSQPETVSSALSVLDEVDRFSDPMVGRACDYLATITVTDGGLPFVLPSVREFPRAPWWITDDDPPGSLLPTASIVGLLHKHNVKHPWLDRATEFCWRAIDGLDTTQPYELRASLVFLDHAPDRARAEAAFDRVGPKMFEQQLVALDPDAPGEVHSPLEYAPRPESMARRLFSDEVIEAHLDALVSTQDADGGWSFNFLAWNPATTLEWRGAFTVETLLTLRAYGRLG